LSDLCKFLSRCRFLAILISSELLWSTCGFAQSAWVDYAYKEAIFKLDVTFSKSERDKEDNELCKSEGTGFVVDRNHVVTATHVFDLDQECGTPTIVGKSFANNSQIVLKVLDSKDDVALLESKEPLTSDYAKTLNTLQRSPCAIPVSQDEFYFESNGAVGYGVPGGFQEPQLTPVNIGSEKGQFSPFVTISPIEIVQGESGGPIVLDLFVVGMIRARADSAKKIGLMTRANEIYLLLQKHSAGDAESTDLCNATLFARRQKQVYLNGVDARILQSGPDKVTGEVVIINNETTFDKNTQVLLTETAKKAVDDSLRRVASKDGMQVFTAVSGSDRVTFEIRSTEPIPVTFPPTPASIDSRLPDVLEFDVKANLNAAFEQQILEIPQHSYAATKTDSQSFDPDIQLNAKTTVRSQKTLLPDKLDPSWNQRLEKLDFGTKVQLNQRLEKLEFPESSSD